MAIDRTRDIKTHQAMLCRRRARHNLEELAVKCLQPAMFAVMKDAAIDDAFNWGIAGDVAVQMAKHIRLRCATETADIGDEELAVLAETITGQVEGSPN